MITSRDKRLYEIALCVARDSDCEDRHGAVLADGGRVLAIATNRDNGHPISDRYGKVTQHAEQRLVQRHRVKETVSTLACWTTPKVTIYSARAHAFHMSAPCEMCQELIQQAGVRRVVYHDGWQLREMRS